MYVGQAGTTSENQLAFSNTNEGKDIVFKNRGSGKVDVSESMRITSEGNVGIGTTNPVEKLHVSGTFYGGAANGYGIKIDGTQISPVSGASITLMANTPESANPLPQAPLVLHTSGQGDIIFETASAERMRISSEGKIGIATKNPAYKLDVEGAVQAKSYLTGDIFFQKDGEKLWRMFEDEHGLYVENLRTNKVYSIVLTEREDTPAANGIATLDQAISRLQVENRSLTQRLEALEEAIRANQSAEAKEVRQ